MLYSVSSSEKMWTVCYQIIQDRIWNLFLKNKDTDLSPCETANISLAVISF